MRHQQTGPNRGGLKQFHEEGNKQTKKETGICPCQIFFLFFLDLYFQMKHFFVCSCFVLFLKKKKTSFVNFEENRWLEGSSSASFQHDLSRERKFSDHKLKFRHAQNAMNQRATCKNSNFLSGRRLSLNGYFFLSFFFSST